MPPATPPDSLENFLSRPVRYLRGVGPKRSEALQRLGIETIGDLFYFFPRRYEDRSRFVTVESVAAGQFVTLKVSVLSKTLKRLRAMTIFEMALGDSSGFIHATWFNQPYLARQFSEGDELIVSGKADVYNSRLQLNSPEYEVLTGSTEDTVHTGRIVPVYPLSEGLGQRGIRRAVKELIDAYADEAADFMPEDLRDRLGLDRLPEAIRNVHFPESQELLECARRRLIFDEFFLFELALLAKIHRDRRATRAYPFSHTEKVTENFKKSLPFGLTGGQLEVIGEIARDAAKPVPMRRLLQGDVGSGKTVVATFCIAWAQRNGIQSVLMAPTEVLAEQHYQTVSRLLSPFGTRCVLLTGSTPASERGEILADLRSGRAPVAIGTHSLIQDEIKFSKLGLVVIDEQHKFGVRQRSALLAGGIKPHLLVMTATPIPRTLGLTLYGDLDISTIRELPAGRKPIQTFWITQAREEEVLRRIAEKLKEGEQAYVIYPVIEETEKSDLAAAKKGYADLRGGVFRDFQVGLIHGRLSRQEKDRVMKDFKEGKVKVLVSTSLVEVGIDNPNATHMVIEHAEKFGLSQLHQLRGRIGRGDRDSYCFLFGEPTTEEGKRRLRVLTKTQDGFAIAEEDLALRGPGDFLGTRQSGVPLFKIGDLLRDADLLRLARAEAARLIERQGGMAANPALREKVERESRHFFNQAQD
ncbi:MAG: ATP-dependent DNA helicase RecG [Candidatus Omnitrophica bacterium]|nr:ATP-dependent DNA helicase RecG [Candidatus Omnitrophota bacterium]